ncbi:MAG: hypothetical protein HC927_11815, partial [Deltaproteobacteria bacterium]|nr:hypothetical protein [Deltaproteobacteria bacterium]
MLHWDGSAWTQELAGTSADLISLWGSGDDDVLAVGGRANGVLVRWDGSAWQALSLASVTTETTVATPALAPGNVTLAAVHPIPRATIHDRTGAWLCATLTTPLPRGE